MSIYSKHINKGESVTIDGDEFILKAAGSSVIAEHYFNLMKSFKDIKSESDSMAMFNNFDKVTVDSITELIKETLKVSYPDEDENEMDVFAMKHLMELLPVVMNLYSPKAEGGGMEYQKKVDRIKAIQQKRQDELRSTNQG